MRKQTCPVNWLAVSVCAALAALACGGSDPQPVTPGSCPAGQMLQAGRCVDVGGGQGGAGQAGSASAGQAGMAQGGAGNTSGTAGGGTGPVVPPGPDATPLDPAAAAAVTVLLTPLKEAHALPGAQPVGAPLAGSFQQGQRLSFDFQAEPGKCYTVIAAGLPTATNVDAQIVPAAEIPGLGSAVLATDKSVGSTAVVGEQPNCFKWALPMAAPLRVLVSVSQGQGLVAAQLYAK